MSDRLLLLQGDDGFRTLRIRPGSSGLVLDGLTGDYEYGLEVSPQYRKRLHKALLRRLRTHGVDVSAESPLADLLKVAYQRGLFHDIVDYRDWLTENQIPYEFFSWISP